MMGANLSHCGEMGAGPGGRSLEVPAEGLGPVIVAFDKERRIPATGASHLKKLTSIKNFEKQGMTYELMLGKFLAWNYYLVYCTATGV